MTLLQIASILIVLAAAFGTLNYFFLKLPSSIGIMLVAFLASVAMMGVDHLIPGIDVAGSVRNLIKGIDFSKALMDGMLGLLLFAGGMHVKFTDLKTQWKAVLLLATIGVALSTLIVGVGFSTVTGTPLAVALVFGALISPTDPVAVLGVLRQTRIDRSLEIRIAGESLFNDGVGYVFYLLLVGIAFPGDSGTHATGFLNVGLLFIREAAGGIILGLILGYLVFRILRKVDDPSLEVTITLALAFGGYVLGEALDVSAPIVAVCSGILIGNIGTQRGMSELTRNYAEVFWNVVDEILNAVLFLMIGFEVLAISFNLDFFKAAGLAVVFSLIARLLSVAVPVLMLRAFKDFRNGTIPIMTWGGLKGGISVALALSLPDSDWKSLILAATYGVVVFSIIVQGLTVGPLARRVGPKPPAVD